MLEGKKKLTDEEILQEYWNNKHPQMPIIYNGRGMRNHKERINIDVRQMVWEDDYMLAEIIEKYNLRCGSYDETAWACQKFICNILKYVGDEKTSNLAECWQFPNESLLTKTGDCEDGAIFMASLMLNAGIPSWRVRVTAGLVLAGKGAATGGHAYVTYCRETDNNWVVLDWCYYADPQRKVEQKPLVKELSHYKDIWFSFNNEFSWSHKKYDIIEHIKKEPK